MPGREFACGPLQREDAEIRDEAAFFGDGHEVRRAKAAKARMVPAQLALEARDGAIFKAHDGLEEHADFVAVEGAAQIRLQRQPVGALRGHGGLEDFDAVAAKALGVGQRDLGFLQHVFGLVVLLGVGHGHAHRHREHDFPIIEGHRRGDGLANPVRQIGDGGGAGFREDDHRELVAGNARQRVLWVEDAPQPPRGGQQHRVACGHAGRVVDLSETIQIDGDHGGALQARGARVAQGGFEAIKEEFAVGQARQIVMHGVMQHAVFGDLAFGDVGERAHHANDLAIGAHHGARLQHEPEVMPIPVAQAEIEMDAPAPLLQHRIEAGAVAVAIKGVEHVEPAGGRAIERAGAHAQGLLRLVADVDVVGHHIPVEDDVASAGEGEGLALDVGDRALHDAPA